VAVALIERARLLVERRVQSVHHRHREALGHRDRGEARVIMEDVEGAPVRGGVVDRVIGRADMVGIV
jgi:hypothetical protein